MQLFIFGFMNALFTINALQQAPNKHILYNRASITRTSISRFFDFPDFYLWSGFSHELVGFLTWIFLKILDKLKKFISRLCEFICLVRNIPENWGSAVLPSLYRQAWHITVEWKAMGSGKSVCQNSGHFSKLHIKGCKKWNGTELKFHYRLSFILPSTQNQIPKFMAKAKCLLQLNYTFFLYETRLYETSTSSIKIKKL